MTDILVIPDSHTRPGISNRRFKWLGKLVLDLKPDVVVDLGDFTDFPSLSSYDGSQLTGGKKPTKVFEGRRYKDDVAAGIEARAFLHEELQRAGRKRPRRIALGGNHDGDRLNRVTNLVPELEGTVAITDQMHKEYGWEYFPFLEPVDIAGFSFAHYHVGGVMGKPAATGENPGSTMLKKLYCSAVQGHLHLWDESHRTKGTGQKIQAISAGVFLDPNQREGYAGPAQRLWDNGITLLKGADKGFAEGGFSFITIKQLQQAYG